MLGSIVRLQHPGRSLDVLFTLLSPLLQGPWRTELRALA